MAYRITKKQSYLKKVEVDLSEQLNCEDVQVTLREPSTKEAFSLRAEDEEKAVEAFKELLPSLIIDHNFYADDEENVKAGNQEVVDIIFENFQAFQKVLSDYTSAVFQAK
jgi:hypothetical protein